jgi:hypothetical protein
MQASNAGSYITFGDVEGCKQALVKLYEGYQKGDLKGASGVDMQAFSNEVITQNLANLLKTITQT